MELTPTGGGSKCQRPRPLPPVFDPEIIRTMKKHIRHNIAKDISTEDVLRSVKGCMIATITTYTKANLPKSKPEHLPKRVPTGFGEIMKRTTSQVILGWNYASRIERAADRQEIGNEYEGGELVWGTHDEANPILIHHKGKLYVQTAFLKNLTPPTYYSEAGNQIASDSPELIALIEHKANQKKKPSTQEFLGDEEHVDVQTYALDSIEKIAVNGYTLTVKERDNAYAMR